MVKPEKCLYCGDTHSVEVLCKARPRWGRRGFLSLFGIGLVGSILPLPTLSLPYTATLISPHTGLTIAQIVAVSYPAVLVEMRKNQNLWMDDRFMGSIVGVIND